MFFQLLDEHREGRHCICCVWITMMLRILVRFNAAVRWNSWLKVSVDPSVEDGGISLEELKVLHQPSDLPGNKANRF